MILLRFRYIIFWFWVINTFSKKWSCTIILHMWSKSQVSRSFMQSKNQCFTNKYFLPNWVKWMHNGSIYHNPLQFWLFCSIQKKYHMYFDFRQKGHFMIYYDFVKYLNIHFSLFYFPPFLLNWMYTDRFHVDTFNFCRYNSIKHK